MAEERLEEIREARLKKRADIIDRGGAPYPSEAKRTHTVARALSDFEELSASEQVITLTGRIKAVRRHGGVVFIDLEDASGKMQLQINKDAMPEEIFARLEDMDNGDFVQVSGAMGQTQRGQNTLFVKEAHLLSKSIRALPSDWYGLKDKEARFRRREVDMLVNEEVRSVMKARSQIINALRSYLASEDFCEVETPVLQPIAGGTLAKPFVTHHNALDIDLYLRIAPELYLKRLLVGGYEKVFEIGKNFRNEGVDREHNPEFTLLEFYWAYADYEDLMDMAENMINKTVRQVLDGEEIERGGTTLTFATPWRRVKYIDAVSEACGFNILEVKDVSAYVKVFEEKGLPIPTVKSYSKMVDEIYKELVRPNLIQPTILYDYPIELSPLAKQSLTDPRIAEMFQVIVAGTELVKAYTELNDPVVQRERFEQQMAEREAGDAEAHQIDEDYIEAMEYGMPPAAGFGLGVDRLVWLVTNADSLRDTIAFPLLKPDTKEH